MEMPNLHALQRFTRAPSLVAPDYADGLIALANSPERNAEVTLQTEKNCAAGFWESNFGTNGKSFIFAGGMAVIPIYGALVHRDNWCSVYGTGYDYISSRLSAAIGDDDVQAVILDVNSFGGQVAGNFELASHIAELRERKPIYAIVDANSLSGGYSLSTAATKIFATPSAQVGSIGVMMMHISYEKALATAGIKPTMIYAGEHKVDGNPYEDLPADVRKALEQACQRSYDQFVSLVASNRNIDPEVVRGTQARVMDADEAKSLGLIDEVMAPRAAYAAIIAELKSGSTQTKEAKSMSNDTPVQNAGSGEGDTARQIAAAKAEGVKEAQTRISSILSCEAAKGKSKLASHIAFNTNLSAEEATALLQASAPETTEQTASPAGPGPLSAAMQADTDRVAGVDAPNAADPESPEAKRAARVARITQSHQVATGRKTTQK